MLIKASKGWKIKKVMDFYIMNFYTRAILTPKVTALLRLKEEKLKFYKSRRNTAQRMLCSSIFNILWVLCPSVAHNSVLHTSLLHILTSCYSSHARLNILILLSPQSPLPNHCLISGFISMPFCQELHFCSSLQCLLPGSNFTNHFCNNTMPAIQR